jgi:hypothetical protein
MPASIKDEEAKEKTGSPSAEVDVVEDDDEGSVEVTEDGSPVQARAVTSDTDDDESDDGDDDAGTEADDKATLERKRKKAAQREASKLRRQLAAQEARQEALEREMAELRAERIKHTQAAVQEAVSAAEQAYEAALEDGDAKGIVEAQRALRKAEAEAQEWERRAPQGSERSQPRASAPAANPLVDDFLDRHGEWFDPSGKDVESAIVVKLSAEIANEGLAPTTKKHFDELEKRMARYLPDRVGGGASKPKPRATAAAPSSSGRGNGAASGNISIPKATIAGFRDALGVDWDDPDPEARKAARAKITKSVLEARRNRGDAA